MGDYITLPSGVRIRVNEPQVRINKYANQGKDGASWYSGSGAPAAGSYVAGDWYIDVVSGDVYEKTAVGVWTVRLNITGSAGAPGADGVDGIGTLAELLAMLSAMTPYDSDDAAKLAGVPFESWYRTTANHFTNPASIKQQMIP